jgi:5'-nucleotidase
MDNKKVIFVDMDGVLCDFKSAWENYIQQLKELKQYENFPENFKEFEDAIIDFYDQNPDLIPNIFENLAPIDGAIDAIKKLNDTGMFDLCVATTSPWESPKAAADKLKWIQNHFYKTFYKSMCITHRKDLLKGDILIDDRTANGADKFEGELIEFGSVRFPNWQSVVDYILIKYVPN